MVWPQQPVIYEVNTAVWLNALAARDGQPRTLADVRPSEWDEVALDGVDAIWLMGVWERSPAGTSIAVRNAELMRSFRSALPDLDDTDIVGSPYCVRRYVVDPAFGGPQALASARAALAARGKKLVLDYVPNHVAPDHAWVTAYPDRFVQGSKEDLIADPQSWLEAGSRVLAHGRDPYFPAWPDVVQLNAFSAETRAATADTLADVATQCDGIRCDMAMLMTNNVFAKTWSGWSGPEPAEEFWPTVIRAMRTRAPEVVLLAEAYWDLEWELQHQGFDFCYDKRLYDRLVGGAVGGVRDHLRADLGYQSRLVRFLENHDEPRIASRIAPSPERACAVAVSTLPGATLWHEGQFEGRRVRPPVFLRRRPEEKPDTELAAWYRSLLSATADAQMRTGRWTLLDVTGWPDNQSCQNLLGWAWHDEGQPAGQRVPDRHVVVVNLSDQTAQGRVVLPWPDLAGRACHFSSLLGDEQFDRDGDEIMTSGLYVALEPWGFHLLRAD